MAGQNEITVNIKGIDLTLTTDPGLFSPRQVDAGTLAMLSAVEFLPDDKVLDLGCGYGVVGIVAARLIGAERVFMIDNDPAAVACARANAKLNHVPDVSISVSDGFDEFGETGFTKILCNPPYHEDFSVPKRFVHKGFNRLALGGQMVMVTKRRKWYEKKLAGIFGGVTVREIDGYHIFTATKKSSTWAKAKN